MDGKDDDTATKDVGLEEEEKERGAEDKPKYSTKLHESLSTDREIFLNELPIVLNKLKDYMKQINNISIQEKGRNLKSLLNRSNAAIRASRRTSVVDVMQQARKVKQHHLEELKKRRDTD